MTGWRFLIAASIVITGSIDAYSQIAEQRQCANIVKNNIEVTKVEKPEVFATVKGYMFEWSRSHRACVMIMQYRVHDKGKEPEIQVLAVNAVTMQNMEGYDNIFLVPANDNKQLMKAVNFLFKRYSH